MDSFAADEALARGIAYYLVGVPKIRSQPVLKVKQDESKFILGVTTKQGCRASHSERRA